MILSEFDLKELVNLASTAAQTAGKIIQSHFKKNIKIQTKLSGSSEASSVVTEVDFLSQDTILHILNPSIKKYDLAYLSEETPDDLSRLSKDNFWCIDPLDGTLPFTENKSGFAVSIALVSKAGIPLVGVVFDPMSNSMYQVIKGQGFIRNRQRGVPPGLKAKNSTEFLWLLNRNFLKDHRFADYQEHINQLAFDKEYDHVKQIYHGGAVMHACWLLEHGPGCYFSLPKKAEGGGCLWDYAATTCLFIEAGKWVSDIEGNPLDLNCKTTVFMNQKGVLFADGQETAESILTKFKPA